MDSKFKWITNSPGIAKALKAADSAYDKAMVNAKHLTLADKIAAIRKARAILKASYSKVANHD